MSGSGIGTPVEVAGGVPLTGLAYLASLVNNETGNTIDRGTDVAEGDGENTQFYICPASRTILETDDFTCWVNNIEDTTGGMNFVTGVYTFPTAPGVGAVITWQFDYLYWSEALVEAAVQSGIDSIFPYFYNATTEVLGSGPEHTFTTPGAEVVTMVATTGTSVVKIKRSTYTTYKSGDNLVLRWYGSAPSGTVRANIVCRPTIVAGSGTPPCTDLNVTNRAIAPIVSYAIYHLLSGKQAPRMRADTALSTVGQGNLSPRQMNDASNSFFLRYQAQCQQGKQLPWSMS